MKNREQKHLDLIAQTIYDKKGFNILALDIRELSSMADYIVIAEGNVDRHVRALAFAVIDCLRQDGRVPIRLEGDQTGDWVVIDYGDIMVHLFMPEWREKYALEELWKKSLLVDVEITIDSEKRKQTS